MNTNKTPTETQRIGAIVRVYAHDEAKVSATVGQTLEAVRVLRALSPAPSVEIMVWTDKRDYRSKSDCGATAGALQAALTEGDVNVTEFGAGDLFVDILNAGVELNQRNGRTMSLVLSPQASSYLTQATWERMLAAMRDGAKAAGVAVKEAGPTIRWGCLANTLCLWDTDALLGVGGFHALSRMPADDEPERPAGVEEVIPLLRMARRFGRCIAVISSDNHRASYSLPDAATDLREYLRNQEKFASKEKRQAYMLSSIGAGFAQLKRGLMPAYMP